MIQCNDFIKIGVASNIGKRLMEMQVCNPYKLAVVARDHVVDPYKLEARLHRLFGHLNKRGEWFQIIGKDAENIAIGAFHQLAKPCLVLS